MYSQKFVACIKHNGRILREDKENIYVPYGAEYSIFLKNLNSVRALAKVEIDGRDVGGGQQFVVPANGSIDISRFIVNGNLSAGNAFKFIEKTAAVSNYRGDKAEDGIVRIEFQFEKVYQPPQYFAPYYRGYNTCSSDIIRSKSVRSPSDASGEMPLNTTSCSVKNENGITVEGSISNQQFQTASWFPVEYEKHVLCFKLLGELGQNRVVEQPVYVTTKVVCETCGRKNKSNAKFCSECGTGLQRV